MAEPATFTIRPRTVDRHVIGMARVMHHAAQQSMIFRHGAGEYVMWEKLPAFRPGQQEIWIAAAEAALAHICSSPSFPIADYMPGGHHG